MNQYKFDCGCSFPVIDDELKSDGLPKLYIPYDDLIEDLNYGKTCPETWKIFHSGHTKGVFQLENNLGAEWSEQIAPSSLEELSAVISVIRPGTLKSKNEKGKSLTKIFADRKKGIEPTKAYVPALEDILKETYQIIVYQESAIRIAQEVAGFSEEDADKLRKCLSGDTLMLTSNGLQKIKNLVGKTPKLLTVDNDKLVYKKCLKVWSNGTKSLLRIKTNNGYSIDVTKNHKIYTNNGWKEAQHLTNDDFIIVANKYQYKGVSKLNKNKSAILAYMISEGCYTDKSPEPKFTNSEESILNHFIDLIIKEFGDNQFKKVLQQKNVYDIYLLDKAKKWFKSIYKKCKSYNKYIPHCIVSATKGVTDIFVACYLNGDGSVENDQISFSSSSKDVIMNLKFLLLRNGIHTSYRQRSTKKEDNYEIAICDRRYISIFYNIYGKYIITRKLQLIEKILNKKYTQNYQSFVIPSNLIDPIRKNLNTILGKELCSGTTYKGNWTYERAQLINNKIGSDYLQSIIDSEYSFAKINSIEKIESQEVFDFELEDDPHAAFANGMLVHNSIGKKDADLMAKIEKWFLDGCKSTKIVTEEQAAMIFGWIKESQRYSFNKSHGISYGSIGYLTALVKEHFPLHFYANWIKNARNKANSQEQIRELIDEAKLYNIPVLLPTLHTLGYNNYDVCIDNGAVRFGISSLKGIGSSLVDKTIEYLETTSAKLDKKIENFSWNDFLIHIAPALGKKTVTALITGGVLPYPLPRSRMLYEYQQIKNLTKIQFEKLKEKDYTNLDRALSKLIDEVSRPQKTKIKNIIKLLNSSASSTKDRPAWIVTQEENLYGMPITYSKMDILKNSQMANTTCQEFIDGKKGDDITLAGELLSFNKFPIKNGKNIGKMMGIGNLHDGTASVKVLFFSKVFAEYENYLYKGNCIYVTGIRNDGKDFIVNDLQEIY